MTLKIIFIVQAFEVQCQRVVPGVRKVAPTESDALEQAKEMAGRLPGAAALKIAAKDETGQVESATILAAFGVVPGSS